MNETSKQNILQYLEVCGITITPKVEFDVEEAMERVLNYLNTDTFPELLEKTLSKTLCNAIQNDVQGNIKTIKESETTIEYGEREIDFDEIISGMKKTLFRFRKVK